MEERLYLYGAAFDGTYVTVNQRVQLTVDVLTCLAEPSFSHIQRASTLTQAASYLVP
jgi:hypothetical protein